jgi:hypothetical protein
LTLYAVRASKLGADPSMSPIVDQLGLTGMVMTKPEAPFRSLPNDYYVAVGAPSLLRSAGAGQRQINHDGRMGPFPAAPFAIVLAQYLQLQ